MISLLLLLLTQIHWQVINRPFSDDEQELVFYFTMPPNKLKTVSIDRLFYAEYEVQLKLFDRTHKQIYGDFWEKRIRRDTVDISDSVRIRVPKNSDYYELRIVDLHGGEIFRTSDKILLIKYLGNISWDIKNDTLTINYTVINPEAEVNRLVLKLEDLEQVIPAKPGKYSQTAVFDVSTLPNGNYKCYFEVYNNKQKIDKVEIPISVARLFFLDDTAWHLKVEQLMYIATPKETNELEKAKKEMRDSLWHSFWKQYDPTPNTKYNEKEVEYFERIAYCETHFSHGDNGWRSDRAKIYVKYGPPDEIESYPYYNPPKNPYNPIPTLYDAYLVWHYYRINRQFIFGDKHGLGQYILLNPGGSNL